MRLKTTLLQGILPLATLSICLAACVPKGESLDGGPADLGEVEDSGADTGTADTGAPEDTGPVDTGPVDTGVIDTGPVDTGPIDTGPVDLGPPDTGPVDTGPADMGAGPDSGFPPLSNWCSGQPANFSFFVTSMNALWTMSGDDINDWTGGFGGNYGGIAGADHICQTIGQATGNGNKTWKAFLSATDDGNGNPVHAIDRVGQGPWYDANGRLVATGIAGLLSGLRPDGDPATTADLPDECGVPLTSLGDSHDVVTASNDQGRLAVNDPFTTCNDWTSDNGQVGAGAVMCGHSWPRNPNQSRGANWRSDHTLRGCGKGANLLNNGPGTGFCIGCSGGYGALYCFAQ